MKRLYDQLDAPLRALFESTGGTRQKNLDFDEKATSGVNPGMFLQHKLFNDYDTEASDARLGKHLRMLVADWSSKMARGDEEVIHTHARLHTHTCTQIHTHTHTHTHKHTHTHTHIHTRTYTHTCTRTHT
jgi:hypothetical protein